MHSKTEYIWNNSDIQQALDAPNNFYGNQIRINTNHILPEDIFIALYNGDNHDGHKYIDLAIQKGAAFCIANQGSKALYKTTKVLHVPDTKKALEKLAFFKAKTIKSKIIAITGSAGKTSTKDIIGKLVKNQISDENSVFVSFSNFNNWLGTLVNLASNHNNVKFSIFEVGMSAPKEIAKIVSILKPNICIITCIGFAHMSAFANIKEVTKAKSEIFFASSPNSTLILSKECEYFDQIKQEANRRYINVKEFGKSGTDAQLISSNGTKQKIKIYSKEYEIETDYIHVNNLLCALLCIKEMNLNLDRAIKSVSNISATQSRGNIIQLKKCQVIDFSYNANPVSVIHNLRNINKIITCRKGRKILILGDMLELGKKSVEQHKLLLPHILNAKITKVATTGKLMKHLYDTLPEHIKLVHAPSSQELSKKIINLIKKDDNIIIQGSNAMNLGSLVEKLRAQ